MKQLILTLFLAVLNVGAHASDCPSTGVDVVIKSANAFEQKAACEGVARALSFFTHFGYAAPRQQLPLTIEFSPQARMDCLETAPKPGCLGPSVAALYNMKTHTIVATSVSNPWMKSKKRPYFGATYSEELYTSVLAHEATHAFNKSFYSYQPQSHAQDEYIAYASQLWSMNKATREKILSSYPINEVAFSSENSINDMVHFAAPHRYGVMSFRHFMSKDGGKTMLERIYSGDYKPSSLDHL